MRTVDGTQHLQDPETPSSGRSALDRVHTPAAWLAVASSWLILRPYLGVIHDAQLYFHTALFGRIQSFRDLDVMLAHDEQMDRSVFVPVVRPLADAVGLATAAVIVTIVNLLAWVAALAWFARTLVGRDWWLVAVAVPAFGAYWGPLFMIAEPFATPRGLAEALVLVGLALALGRRFAFASAAVVLAGVLHPIIGLSGVAVVAIIAAIHNRRLIPWIASAAVAGVLVAAWDPLVLAGTESFTPGWLSVISERAGLVLPGEWPPIGWVRTLFGFAVVAALWRVAESRTVRTMSLATLIASGAGLATSILFSWVWIRPFVTQLQPWRVLWILHLMAIVGVVVFTLDAIRTRTSETSLRALVAWLLALTVGVRSVPLGYLAIVVISIPFLFPVQTNWQRALVTPRVVRIVSVLLGAIVALQLVTVTASLLVNDDLSTIPWIGIGSQFPAVTVAVAGLTVALAIAVSTPGMARWLGVAGFIVVAVFGIATWDHRTDFQTFYESVEEPILDLPEDAVVLVEHDAISTSTLFQRPTYYSGFAGAGVVFSEELATTYDRHAVLARSIGIGHALNYRLDQLEYDELTTPSLSALQRICEDPAGPTHLFLRRPNDAIPGIVWISPVEVDQIDSDGTNPAVIEDGFILYDCADVTG